jgi:hypothetical protein
LLFANGSGEGQINQAQITSSIGGSAIGTQTTVSNLADRKGETPGSAAQGYAAGRTPVGHGSSRSNFVLELAFSRPDLLLPGS